MLPLAVVSPQTFRSEDEDTKEFIKAHAAIRYRALPAIDTVPGSPSAQRRGRSSRFGASSPPAPQVHHGTIQVGIALYSVSDCFILLLASENSDRNSDPDPATLPFPQHAGGGDAAKDPGLAKQRRQQKRLEVANASAATTTLITHYSQSSLSSLQSDKVAKKPKPSFQPPCGEDDNDAALGAAAKTNGAHREEKSFNFIGEVLYNVCTAFVANSAKCCALTAAQGEDRRFYGRATLAGLSETISVGDVCWCGASRASRSSIKLVDFFADRLMSDNPERPYIGRIIAMWEDKTGTFALHHRQQAQLRE
jgi:hypothetical protein